MADPGGLGRLPVLITYNIDSVALRVDRISPPVMGAVPCRLQLEVRVFSGALFLAGSFPFLLTVKQAGLTAAGQGH